MKLNLHKPNFIESNKTKLVKVKDELIGGDKLSVIAGPCAVESEEQILETAKIIKKAGVKFLRGGAYKARTSPYDFQGLKDEGFKLIRYAADKYNLFVVSEVISEKHLHMAYKYCDIIQIGARNMQNFSLLTEAGKLNKPILLKRGLCATINEWLDAANYITNEGNSDIILCERGIRTFETDTRSTLDISSIPVIKQKSNFPIIVDPSHAAGDYRYVTSLSLAAVAAGADGLLVEVHNNPDKALSDKNQQLKPDNFFDLMDKLKGVVKAVKRTI